MIAVRVSVGSAFQFGDLAGKWRGICRFGAASAMQDVQLAQYVQTRVLKKSLAMLAAAAVWVVQAIPQMPKLTAQGVVSTSANR